MCWPHKCFSLRGSTWCWAPRDGTFLLPRPRPLHPVLPAAAEFRAEVAVLAQVARPLHGHRCDGHGVHHLGCDLHRQRRMGLQPTLPHRPQALPPAHRGVVVLPGGPLQLHLHLRGVTVLCPARRARLRGAAAQHRAHRYPGRGGCAPHRPAVHGHHLPMHGGHAGPACVRAEKPVPGPLLPGLRGELGPVLPGERHPHRLAAR